MNEFLFDKLIIIVANAYMAGANSSKIHDVLLNQNLSEDDIFLVMKAGKILFLDRCKLLFYKRSM